MYLLRAEPASPTKKPTVANGLRQAGRTRLRGVLIRGQTGSARRGRRDATWPPRAASTDVHRVTMRDVTLRPAIVSLSRPAPAPLPCGHGAPAGRPLHLTSIAGSTRERIDHAHQPRAPRERRLPRARRSPPHNASRPTCSTPTNASASPPSRAEQARLFFKLLCYGALAAQPAPEAVVDADWRRLEAAGVVDALFADDFDLKRYALDPPVSRNDSKGKVIDFVRLAESRDTWSRLLPQPDDPDVAVDVLHAASGGRPQVARLLGGARDAPPRPVAGRSPRPLRLRTRRARAQARRAHGAHRPAREGRHVRRHEGCVARTARRAASRARRPTAPSTCPSAPPTRAARSATRRAWPPAPSRTAAGGASTRASEALRTPGPAGPPWAAGRRRRGSRRPREADPAACITRQARSPSQVSAPPRSATAHPMLADAPRGDNY